MATFVPFYAAVWLYKSVHEIRTVDDSVDVPNGWGAIVLVSIPLAGTVFFHALRSQLQALPDSPSALVSRSRAGMAIAGALAPPIAIGLLQSDINCLIAHRVSQQSDAPSDL